MFVWGCTELNAPETLAGSSLRYCEFESYIVF